MLNRADKVEEVEALSQELMQTNVVGNIHLFNLFLPLVQKSKTKKVITISTGVADLDLTNEYEVDVSALYSASKAAMNMIVAKFNTQYKKDGVLFFSISPGMVEVGRFANSTPLPFFVPPLPSQLQAAGNAFANTAVATPEQMQGLGGLLSKLTAYAPHFKGPIPVEESVQKMREVWEKASIETGFGGAFVSHYGNKQWL